VKGDERLFSHIAGIMVTLTAFDLLTTYAGVCMLGGIELNLVGVLVGNYGGFLGVIVFAGTEALFGAWVFAHYIRKNSWWFTRAIIAAAFAILITTQARAVVGNAAGIISIIIQEPVAGQHGGVTAEAAAAFDRAAFCRWWP